MVLKNSCKELLLFYTEVVNVYDGLQRLGKRYKNPNHINYFIENVEFYRKAVGWTPAKRLAHLPKILKDSLFLKKKIRSHEKNHDNLDVYNKLHYAGFNFVES
ncbi:MAG TPA: hypothetical protein VJA47_04370 [archaeon]|nr:hypothetical protein [archaeon]